MVAEDALAELSDLNRSKKNGSHQQIGKYHVYMYQHHSTTRRDADVR